MVTNKEFRAATERGRRVRTQTPTAIAAHYDRHNRRIVVVLKSGIEISFPPGNAQGLEDAAPAQLRHIEISPSGLGLHFPKLDADVYIPALLEGIVGSRKWMAARLGAAGGRSASAVKRQASRANGRLGGRPRKAIGS